jgi:hypothetical protein
MPKTWATTQRLRVEMIEMVEASARRFIECAKTLPMCIGCKK